MDENIDKRINKNQGDFFAAFKNKMKSVMKEMGDLKNAADSEKLKLKSEDKMVSLVKERDWFRDEALKINKMNRKQIFIS